MSEIHFFCFFDSHFSHKNLNFNSFHFFVNGYFKLVFGNGQCLQSFCYRSIDKQRDDFGSGRFSTGFGSNHFQFIWLTFVSWLSRQLKENSLITAIQAHWIPCHYSFDRCIGQRFKYVFILFLWEIGHGKLWKYGQLSIRFKLVGIATRFEEILDFDDRKCTTTNSL